jgi:hypothetical protein
MRRLLLTSPFLLLGCASNDRMELITGSNQEAIVRNGTPALYSRKKHLVMLSANASAISSHERPGFTLAVRNMGSKGVLLTTPSISASGSIENKRTALKVFSYDELVKEEQERQTVAAFATALSAVGGAMAASQAGYVHTTGSVSGNTYGRPYHGTYSATTYDPYRAQLATQAAQDRSAADFASLRAEGEVNLARLNATILKDHTVMPGEWYGGVIVLAVPPKDQAGAAEYTIAINFDGEVHEFKVRQSRLR